MALDIMQELESAGAVYRDKHFSLVSGNHGSAYINLDPLFPNVKLIAQICELLAQPFLGEVDTVCAPATGGIELGVLTTLAFVNQGQDVKGVWADKDGKEFAFERAGFIEQVQGKRVLVVEDLLNTGFSVEKVCRLIEAHDGQVAGVSVICNRGSSTAESLNVPRLEALTKVSMEVFRPEACPLCEAKVPMVEDISHGDKFKANNPTYPGGFIRLQTS
jgi:orotate phosphoribosyltransferase